MLYILTKTCTFDMCDYCKCFTAVRFNNIGVGSLKIEIAPKHAGAN